MKKLLLFSLFILSSAKATTKPLSRMDQAKEYGSKFVKQLPKEAIKIFVIPAIIFAFKKKPSASIGLTLGYLALNTLLGTASSSYLYSNEKIKKALISGNTASLAISLMISFFGGLSMSNRDDKIFPLAIVVFAGICGALNLGADCAYDYVTTKLANKKQLPKA